MFCTNCGAKIAEGSAFCSSCGKSIAGEEAQRDEIAESGDKGVFCPNCRSYDLNAISESNTEVKGGDFGLGSGCCGAILLGPIGLLCGFLGRKTKSKSTSRLYWVCKSCGHKFRNAEDAMAEEQQKEEAKYGAVASGGLFVALAGFVLSLIDVRLLGIPNWIFVVGGLIVAGMAIFAALAGGDKQE